MIDAGFLLVTLLSQSFEQRGFIENRTVVYPQTASPEPNGLGGVNAWRHVLPPSADEYVTVIEF